MKYILTIIFGALAAFLCWNLYTNIQEPIRFNKEKEKRDAVCISKLKQARALQLAFRGTNARYSQDWDELTSFAKKGNILVERKIGDPNDTTVVARIDTLFIPVLDSIFGGNRAMADSLRKIPFSNGKNFLISAGNITKNDLEIPAFEVKTRYEDLYDGMIKKYYAAKFGKYMRVGSMEDASTSGNWR